MTGKIAGGDEPIAAYISEDRRIACGRCALSSNLENRTVPADKLDIGHASKAA